MNLEQKNDLAILGTVLESIKKDTSPTDEEKNKFLITLFGNAECKLTCNQTVLFIYLLYHASDGNNNVGHNYIRNVIEVYERYLSTPQAREVWRSLLTCEVKVKVINILREKSFKLVKRILPAISNIFELSSIEMHPYLHKTLSSMSRDPEKNGFFFWSDYFEIYDAIEEHIYGLYVLKKKKIMAENVKRLEFLDKIDEDRRARVIKFFDRLIPINICFREYKESFRNKLKQFVGRYCEKYQYLKDIHNILEIKTIDKLISNVVKRFDMKEEVILHTHIYKLMDRLTFHYGGYLKGIRNGESSTALVNFYQHVLSELGNCPDAFQTFIKTFYDMKHGEEICFFTIFFMPKLKEYIDESSKEYFNKEDIINNYSKRFKLLIERDIDIEELYNGTRQEVIITENLEPYTKIFGKIDVYLVQNEEHFEEALSWLNDAELIGVDTEFLPNAVGGGLSLCQVAISNGVLIFDALKVSVKKKCWRGLMEFLFITSKCPILFFDYKNDFKMLQNILNDIDEENLNNPSKRIVDVQLLYINSLKEPRFLKFLKDNFIVEVDRVSLKDIAKSITGLDMEKEFQFASWRLRPLPLDMIKYAATDAFVLILIYKTIKEIINDDALFSKLEDISKYSTQDKNPTPKINDDNKIKKKKENSSISEIIEYIKNDTELLSYTNISADFRLFVDSMILNLRYILSILGFKINTAEVENYGPLESDDTIILSVGKAVNQWKRNNRYNRIISLNHDDSLEDKVLYIFKELKVRFEKKLVAQRCNDCFGGDIVIVSRLLLLFMYYDAFLSDIDNHKHITNFDEISEESLEKNLHEDKENGLYNSITGLYHSKDYVIDVKNKTIMFTQNNEWTNLPQQKQNAFLKIYYTPHDFMLCRSCNTFSASHKF
uniref:3'-5' exonuclease domain-containing protein n=1 Tax=Strongyloides papillosus TaxID=174720 RepID=A0A0N5BKA7_STREA